MKAKHIIGIILYSLEALFFLLILIGSPSAMSIIDAAMAGNHSDNPAVNAAYTLLKTALVAILIYGLFGIVLAIIGIIFSAKKKRLLFFLSFKMNKITIKNKIFIKDIIYKIFFINFF